MFRTRISFLASVTSMPRSANNRIESIGFECPAGNRLDSFTEILVPLNFRLNRRISPEMKSATASDPVGGENAMALPNPNSGSEEDRSTPELVCQSRTRPIAARPFAVTAASNEPSGEKAIDLTVC